jgi:acetoin utilization deacetylase AcuC-like enzyme
VADRDRPNHDRPVAGLTATKPGSAPLPLPGISAALVDFDGDEMDEGTGLLVLTRPWPGMLRTLVGDDERFVSTYFERFGPRTYVVGDAARRDGDGYFWVIGGTDDVINVSGNRLSTAEVESAIVAHAKVAEAAVVAEADELSGQAIVAFVTLNAGLRGDEQVAAEIRAYVGERIGKLARPKSIIWADDLPKTRSSKITCVGCCGTSPRGVTWATSRRWATRRSCADSRRRRPPAERPPGSGTPKIMSESVLLVWSEKLLTYDLGATHPMAPGRLEFTMALAHDLGVLAGRDLRIAAPRPASRDVLQLVHEPAYVAAVRGAWRHPSLQVHDPFGLGSEDNPVFDGIHDASALVTGATVDAAMAVRSGAAQHAVNLAGGLHHAMPARASGFCIYNDAAVAIASLLADGVQKVAYVDLDAHHGDGVEAAFYRDPRVLTISLHESGYTAFPGTGFPSESGHGAAEGTSVNVALPPGTGDGGWLRAFHAVVPPLVRASSRRSWSPNSAATPTASIRWPKSS